MTSTGNEEETAKRPLFETLARELPGEGTNRENYTTAEWDGRTPYGQLGSDGVLRSTRTEPSPAAPPNASTGGADTYPIISFRPENSTMRKRSIVKVKIADKVLPSGDIVKSPREVGVRKKTPTTGSTGKKERRKRDRGAADLSTSQVHDSQSWYGVDEEDANFLDHLERASRL